MTAELDQNLTPQGMQPPVQLSSRKRRIAAIVIDYCVMMFLMVILMYAIIGPGFTNQPDQHAMMISLSMVTIPALFLYFAKDSIRGISVGKWVMGIMIREESNPEVVPSFFNLFVRNLFLVIWPVEFIVLAVSRDKKRIGDQVLKTIVIKNPDKSGKAPRLLVVIALLVAFIGSTFLFTTSAIKDSEAYLVAVSEIEKDPEVLEATGGIKGFGDMPMGNISITNDMGEAQLKIKVNGIENDVTVHANLTKEPGAAWILVDRIVEK